MSSPIHSVVGADLGFTPITRLGDRGELSGARPRDACYKTVFLVISPAPGPAAAAATIPRLALSGLRYTSSRLLEDSIHALPPGPISAFGLEPAPRRSHSRARAHLLIPPAPSREPFGDLPHVFVVRVEPPPRPQGFTQITQDLNDPLDEMTSLIGTMPSISRFSHGGAWPSLGLDNLEEHEEYAKASSSVARAFRACLRSSQCRPFTDTHAGCDAGETRGRYCTPAGRASRHLRSPSARLPGQRNQTWSTRGNQSRGHPCSTA